MLRVITHFIRACTTGYRASAPASTFLMATVFTLVVAFGARLAIGAVPPEGIDSHPVEIVYSPSAVPGGVVKVAVESDQAQDIRVYLPGLSAGDITLGYDARTGYHLGDIPVPATAPAKGYCTLRVVFADGAETDLMVALSHEPPTT